MIKVTHIEELVCDCCGKGIEKTAHCREGFHYAIRRLEFERWYDGQRVIQDICDECNEKICTFLYGNGFFAYAGKK